jgi:hypothetical protein
MAVFRDGEKTMPKETFWSEHSVEGDDSLPYLTVSWGQEHPGVSLNGFSSDRSGLNRLIRVLRNARDKAYGRDE